MRDDRFEWDDTKAAANPRNHEGVTFTQARTVFDDFDALEIYDERDVYYDLRDNIEDRFNIIGMDATGNVLTVSYTWRGHRHRIITARKATAHEIKEYDQNRLANRSFRDGG
jgi:uncharacterized DUF497 family protein